MPNWVINYLTIKREDAKYVLNDEGNVDFNMLVPRPKELNNTIAGGSVEDCIALVFLKTHTKKEYLESTYNKGYLGMKSSMTKKEMEQKLRERIGDNPMMFDSEWSDKERPKHTPEEVGEYYLALEEKYGYLSWYGWSYDNWGVKWNASNSDVINEDDDDELLYLKFDTPWGYPDKWLRKLSRKCPFHLAWEEEQGYRGIITADGGIITRNMELPMLEWDEDGCSESDDWIDELLDTVFKKGA
jgi:hypothetical protein